MPPTPTTWPSRCARWPRVRCGPTGRSATPSAAAPLAAGRYVDRIGADQERWYAVRLERGQRLAAAAVVSHACPFARGLAEMFGTALELDLFRPDGELPEAGSGVANLFVGDESSESDGLLTMPVGEGGDAARQASRPGRYLLRVRLSDNGNGVLTDALDGASLALQLQANITGDSPAVGSPGGAPARTPQREPGRAVATLVAVAVVGLLLGALLSWRAVRLRGRRG
jgi:hypothetical protein